MKSINLLLTVLVILALISCEKDINSCGCNPEDGFNKIVYKLDSVIDMPFRIYNSDGLQFPLDDLDTLIRYDFYKYFSGVDSIYITNNSTGEYFSHYRFLKDTLVGRTLFSYTLEENIYKIIPINYGSTVIIDPYEDDHIRALNYGEDDTEIIENLTRTYNIDGDYLTIKLYDLRLSQGMSTIYYSAQSFNEEITNQFHITETLYLIQYKLVYKKL